MQRTMKAAHKSQRCLAKTRRGSPCMAPAVKDKQRCRMHGGAAGSGAPKGNQNHFIHGRYGAEAKATRRLIAALRKQARRMAMDDL